LEAEAMPYSPKQKRDTREKIIESARRLFNLKGYSGVSIAEIMRDAGLTHGGFYRHFAGKDELYAAAVRQFLCKEAPAAWQKRREPNAVTKHRAHRIVDAYFSREHFDDHEGCCPLLGTASDVERSGEAVKIAYQEVVEQLLKVFEDHLSEPRARERALALVALCVGGMVLARNVGDSGLADDFRRSAYAEVLRTAGWTESTFLQRGRLEAEQVPAGKPVRCSHRMQRSISRQEQGAKASAPGCRSRARAR
jgi:TetR/AcrR family transcriptional regulator, transcriptional repressor for nem operon